MRHIISVLIFLIIAKPLSEQIDSTFMKCSIELNKFVGTIDTLSLETAVISNLLMEHQKKWTDCIQNLHIPNFNAITLNGDSFAMEKIIDKVIVINFWSSNCAPCIAELSIFPSLNEQYKAKEVLFISICVDKKNRFTNRSIPGIITIVDAQKIIELYGINSYPQTFIISKKHLLKKVFSGASLTNNQELEDKIGFETNSALMQ